MGFTRKNALKIIAEKRQKEDKIEKKRKHANYIRILWRGVVKVGVHAENLNR